MSGGATRIELCGRLRVELEGRRLELTQTGAEAEARGVLAEAAELAAACGADGLAAALTD